ncbi:MAG TPA: hypothetical protein VMV17_24805 [Streptosporangiaceae bacterium]|nr:hypothetical protein [Streptosporangiaceae bacterium]
MSKVLLTLAYFLLVVPAGLVLRVVRDPLRQSWSARRPSYWQTPPDPGR